MSSLYLFQQIIESKALLPNTDGARDLIQMITFILRKFFKKVQEDPFLIVEALTPKTRGTWKAISSYKSDESDSDGGGGGGVRNKKDAAELEFVKKKNLSWSQQMEVVIGVLFKDGKQALVEWIVEVSLKLYDFPRYIYRPLTYGRISKLRWPLAPRSCYRVTDHPSCPLMISMGRTMSKSTSASGWQDRARTPWPDSLLTVRRTMHSLSSMSLMKPDLEADSAEKRGAVMSNAHFRLMLNLLAFRRSEEENSELADPRQGIDAIS